MPWLTVATHCVEPSDQHPVLLGAEGHVDPAERQQHRQKTTPSQMLSLPGQGRSQQARQRHSHVVEEIRPPSPSLKRLQGNHAAQGTLISCTRGR